VAVADVDVLNGEGIAFSEKLQKAGVKVMVKEYAKPAHTPLLEREVARTTRH
jgi:acetyl esterase/lipase